MKKEKLTIVYDNRALEQGCAADWGFGCMIEKNEHSLLFDVGAKKEILSSNMELLWVPQSSHIFISHNHYDHTDGIEAAISPGVTCWMVPSALEDLGARVEALGGVAVASKAGEEILPGMRTTGEMASEPPEQGLVIESNSGPIFITGCAHPGIVQMVMRAGELFGKVPTLLVGGFHWYECSLENVGKEIDELKRLGVKEIAPCHCTGDDQIQSIGRIWGEGFHNVGAGWSMTLE